jgi:hypothetical protein
MHACRILRRDSLDVLAPVTFIDQQAAAFGVFLHQSKLHGLAAFGAVRTS